MILISKPLSFLRYVKRQILNIDLDLLLYSAKFVAIMFFSIAMMTWTLVMIFE